MTMTPKEHELAASDGTPSRQLRQVLAMALLALAIAALTGLLVHLTARQWLTGGLATALVLWVGGAVSGQVLLARLLDRGTPQEVLDFNRLLLWVIPRFYVPASVIALGCGITLIAVTGTPVLTARVLIPLALYVMTTVLGTAVSAPGYTRLTRYALEHGPDHPDVRHRLLPLAWVNRIELTLVISLGFTLLASFTD